MTKKERTGSSVIRKYDEEKTEQIQKTLGKLFLLLFARIYIYFNLTFTASFPEMHSSFDNIKNPDK